MNVIYQLMEGVSLFDMIMSFATLCTSSKGFSRPIFEAVCATCKCVRANVCVQMRAGKSVLLRTTVHTPGG
jgi:hypothetical protein